MNREEYYTYKDKLKRDLNNLELQMEELEDRYNEQIADDLEPTSPICFDIECEMDCLQSRIDEVEYELRQLGFDYEAYVESNRGEE